MKTIIIIENSPIEGSKVTVQVDDNQPVAVGPSPVVATDTPEDHVIKGLVPMNHTTNPLYSPAPPNTVIPEEPAIAVPVEPVRRCSECNDDISGLNPRRKICMKPECKRAKANAYKLAYWNKMNKTMSASTAVADAVPKPRTKPCTGCGDDMPLTSMYDKCANCRPQKVSEKKEKACKLCTKLGRPCKRHRNGEVIVTKPAATFLPGYEKTPEEIEALRPKAINLPGESVPLGGVRSVDSTVGRFDDPWNCQMCRDGEALCTLHTKMSADGKRPPQGFGTPESRVY